MKEDIRNPFLFPIPRYIRQLFILKRYITGWTYCAAAIGVAAGYVVGGQTLSLFVDIDKVNMNK